MTKRKSRAYTERFRRVDRVIAQYYINKCRPTYFNMHILPKIYNFRRRISLWIYPKSDCFGFCLTCKCYNSSCRDGFAEHWE